jgi:hypothetical protein
MGWPPPILSNQKNVEASPRKFDDNTFFPIMSAVHTVINNHVIPDNDEAEHIPHDWCECKPFSRLSNNGIMWVHPAFDMRHILYQAEVIRKITSLRLWSEEDQREPKRLLQVYPLPDSDTHLEWPQPANK